MSYVQVSRPNLHERTPPVGMPSHRGGHAYEHWAGWDG
jgi:hypothetical protein